MKSDVIDVVQALAGHAEPVGRWQTAVSVSEALGFSHILVAQVDAVDRGIDWVNTSMTMDWLEEYLTRDYLSIDPLFHGTLGARSTSLMQAGLMSRTMAPSALAYDLDHGVKAAGMDALVSTRFGAPGATGVHVTLVREGKLEDMQAACPIDLALFQGILGTAVSAPVPSRANDLLKSEPTALTVRQREVLSLLAEGMMTARIAEQLGITEAAVNKHFIAARQKLDAATREQAMAKALLQGLISL